MVRRLGSSLAVVLALVGNAARADTVVVSGMIPLTTTSWSLSVSVPKFDPALGDLQSVGLRLTGTVSGDIRLESLDMMPTTITGTLQTLINLNLSGLGDGTLEVNPMATRSFAASSFDGLQDFGGTSGASFLGVGGSATTSLTSTSPELLAAFTGIGNVTLPVTATGTSFGTGAGNLLTQFQTRAGADVEVTYTFIIPEPASLTLLGLGSLGLTLYRRYRRQPA